MLFTVFTPVYNRASKIHRVWDSLQAQTYRDFEWIVVDDGSKDNVLEILESYKKKADFPVHIISQENKGKHVAWNKAVDLARGELFVPADSDDTFFPNTLSRFAALYQAIPPGIRSKYSGINVLCQDEKGNIVGNPYPYDIMTSDSMELYYVYKVYGEKWGCLRTELLRERKFPEIRGRGCFPLTWLFFYLAKDYRILCVNETLRVYYQDDASCISTNAVKKRKEGAMVNYMKSVWHLSENIDYLQKHACKRRLLREFCGMWNVAFLAGQSISKVFSDLQKPLSKGYAAVTFLPGLCKYYQDYVLTPKTSDK